MPLVGSSPVGVLPRAAGMYANTTPSRIPRIRGSVLCVFPADRSPNPLEAALTRSGLTLWRARNDLHAVILARTSSPHLIIVDVSQPANTDRTVLEQLRRQPKTAAIPVLALVPALRQGSPGKSVLRHASATMLRSAPLETILSEVRRLLTPAESWFHRIDPSAACVDAVFSEFGRRHRGHERRPAGRTPSTSHNVNRGWGQPIHKVDPAHAFPAAEHLRSAAEHSHHSVPVRDSTDASRPA